MTRFAFWRAWGSLPFVAWILAVLAGIAVILTLAVGLPLAVAFPPWLRAVGVALALAALAGLAWVLRYRSVARLAASTSHTLRWAVRGERARGAVDEALVIEGPHRLVRHPWYASLLLLDAGIGLATGWMAAFTFLLLHFAWVRFAVVPLEERELLERYGAAYAAYQRRVPVLLPKLVRVGEGRWPPGVPPRARTRAR